MNDTILRKFFVHFAIGCVLIAVDFLGTVNSTPTFKPNSEPIPVSARDNPASYKPVYKRYTGWHPLPVGGGYSSGK